ncbi:MAG: esterase-like activity of phytase family protein [Rhodospirillaceae bacterium]
MPMPRPTRGHIHRVTMALIAGALPILCARDVRADAIDVTAVPLPLHMEKPELEKVGKLIYRGGVSLESPSDRFGGFSALGLSQDGRRMVSLTDEGNRLDAQIVYGPDGKLAGLKNAEIFTLQGPGGIPLMDKSMADAESMAPGVNGEIIVSFEQVHRLWAYPPGSNEPVPLPLPEEMKAAKPNRGIEALTLLNDGALFALSEGIGRGDATLGWISDTKGWSVLLYKGGDGYRPTGAATLPGGDVVIVERYFTPREGVRVRVRRIDHETIKAGASIRGELLADLQPPFNVENFEGIEAVKGPRGETLIFLISDNNFNRFGSQRTLLMMFELDEK